MGWYNVVEPCVVGQLHYARPTAQPIQVDDEVAAPLVEAGNLTPYPAGEAAPDPERSIEYGSELAATAAQGIAETLQPEAPKPPARGRRRTES